jgi:hypothetical protein
MTTLTWTYNTFIEPSTFALFAIGAVLVWAWRTK